MMIPGMFPANMVRSFGIGGNDANTIMLLHCDGTDGSTTFTDSCSVPKTVTPSGNAQIDTAQSVFGGASALFDGSGDYLTVTSHAAFAIGTGAFTIDFRVRFNSLASLPWLFSQGSSQNECDVYFNGSTNVLGVYVGGANKTFSWSPSINTWYHIAVVRDGSNLRAFVNGAQIGSTLTSSESVAQANIKIGAQFNNNQPFNGWLDEIRFSNIARWTSNFTPPAGAYD